MAENLNPFHKVPAVRAYRGGECENIHFASSVVCSKTGDTYQLFPRTGNHRVFLRSAAKPFQAFPLYQNHKANEITLEEWAIICASHAASKRQLELVHQVLHRAEATPDDLQCGPHPPFDTETALDLLCSHTEATPIHNNCSGKHAGMLLACRLYGWPISTYLDPEHPLQKAILAVIQTYAETSEISLGVDGCGAPVFCLPLQNIARLFSHFVTQPAFDTLVRALITYPDIVGDPQRIDTCLMTVSQGNIVAKVGAEGFLGLANRNSGEGMALKIHDGANTIRDRLIIALLEKLGWLTPQQAEVLWQMPAFSPTLLNTQGKAVGRFEFTLPG